MLAGLYYWLPRETLRLTSDWLGLVTFGLVFGGVLLTFLP